MEFHKAKMAKDVYFRAYLCAEMLKQNGFIEEIDYFTYKITKQGKSLLERAEYRQVKELGLKEIAEITGKVNFYSLSIIQLNNGELIYCANIDELEKYKELDNKPKKDEVKMTEQKEILEVDFDDISNKRKVSNKYKEKYYIYRISNIYSNNPKIYKINGRIEENSALEATSYKARKKVK